MELKKRVSLALLAVGISGLATAGTFSPPVCTSHPVTIPCADTAWDVGFEAFWAEGTSNDQNYARDTGVATNIDSYYTVDPDYEFGFELEGSFHFSTGNDITVSWEYFHDDNNASFVVSAAQVGNITFDETQFNAAVTEAASDTVRARHDFEFDAVNFEFGQHIDVGSDVDLRLHGGLQYARVEYLKQVTDTTTAGSVITGKQFSDFDGFGARVGADTGYLLGNGFGAVVHGSMSLLVGDIDSSNRVTNNAGTVTAGYNFTSDSVVVPAAMAKAGFNYMADVMDGSFSIEGGWRWEGYFNSMRFVGTASANYDNFTFHGPYLAAKYVS